MKHKKSGGRFFDKASSCVNESWHNIVLQINRRYLLPVFSGTHIASGYFINQHDSTILITTEFQFNIIQIDLMFSQLRFNDVSNSNGLFLQHIIFRMRQNPKHIEDRKSVV